MLKLCGLDPLSCEACRCLFDVCSSLATNKKQAGAKLPACSQILKKRQLKKLSSRPQHAPIPHSRAPSPPELLSDALPAPSQTTPAPSQTTLWQSRRSSARPGPSRLRRCQIFQIERAQS